MTAVLRMSSGEGVGFCLRWRALSASVQAVAFELPRQSVDAAITARMLHR
jgi:hypothetical protein